MRAALMILTFALSIQASTYYVTVAGLGGEPDYEQRFAAWALDAEKALKAGESDVVVETLHGATATRARLRTVLESVAEKAGPADVLVLMMIGHGSFDGFDYKMNLPGPDITAIELAGLLDRIPAARQLIVNMTSASGASLPALQKEKRIVVTATKSGTEKNATIFARYWVQALQDLAADTDKNEVISGLEAFQYADDKTTAYYESQKRLATEHALLEDTGMGEGVREPSPQNGRGLAAAGLPLVRFRTAQTLAQNPEQKKLLDKKEELELQIDRLKYQKAAMPEIEYFKELTVLLLDLARTQAALDKQ